MSDVMGIAHRSQVVKTRRGFTLLGLGFILPGSAQAIQGNRKVGRFALKLLIVLVLFAVLVLVLTLLFRDFMIGVLANGLVLKIAAIFVFALGTFWAGLAINTWWIARPPDMGAKKGLIFSLVAIVLAVALSAGTVWVGRAAWVTGGALSNIFSGGGTSVEDKGRLNILLLGSDAGPDRWGVRPDSITVASVDANTGRTVLFSLPRNLEYVPFPESSPLHALYPGGYGCDTSECLLNAVYLLGMENAELYPGVDDPGVQAMIDAASGTTGLTINYYAMIDMQGFVDLIDAMGGLTMTIHQRIALNLKDDVWLEAGENQHLTGYETLWFARTRAQSSDYDRMQRQKCVMAAMLKQLDPSTVAMRFIDIASASGETARTSVPSSKVSELVSLALKARSSPIISVSFTPPLISPGDPDFDFIRSVVVDKIAESEALDAQPSPSSNATTDSTDDPGPEPNDEPSDDETSGNITDDLGQICSVN